MKKYPFTNSPLPVLLGLAVAALLTGCVASEGVVSEKGSVTKVDGDTVIVSIALPMDLKKITGPAPEQTATAQEVCSLKRKTAKYVSMDTRTKDYGAGITYPFMDFIFLCV